MKNLKKFAALMLAGMMTLSMAACGGNSASAPAATDDGAATEATADGGDSAAATEATSDMAVAMVTDYGDITDQSFNQTTYEACKAFGENNGIDFTYYKPEGDSTAERVAMIDKAVADGYNVIVMPGFAFGEAIQEVADIYPDVKFVALDVSEFDLGGSTPANVYTAVYQEELPGYMAGYAAVKLGYKKLGYLGGMAVPAVIRYGYGFVQGADAAAKELGLSDVEVKYAYGNQFFGDADITAVMDTWYGAGTEIVFAAGGSIYESACEAAQKTDGKVIGVDVDQKAIIDGKFGDGMTVTSAMKGLAATVNTILGAIKDGNWADYAGKTETLGLVSGTDMSLNYVGLPDSTSFGEGFEKADYEALVAAMVSGEVTVDNDSSSEEPKAETVKVDFQGNIK